jgi:ATP adenylyltransferase
LGASAAWLGFIPGRVRYETLKRANIVPQSQGGTDDADNLQALCWLCNTNKGAGDDADLRNVGQSYAHRDKDCVFCVSTDSRALESNALAVLLADAFPVTEGHLLAIPRRHVADYFDLYQPEQNAIQRLLDGGRTHLRQLHPDVTGFNVGINSGESAGQTIFHCHVHLIPRRDGDVAEPRGCVRGVIPGRSSYRA